MQKRVNRRGELGGGLIQQARIRPVERFAERVPQPLLDQSDGQVRDVDADPAASGHCGRVYKATGQASQTQPHPRARWTVFRYEEDYGQQQPRSMLDVRLQKA